MKNPLTRPAALALLVATAVPATAQDLHWMRQLGSSSIEYGVCAAVDGAGNAYIGGYTFGSLGGPNAGSADAFLAKYDAAGALLWKRQLGTSGDDSGNGVAVDGAGNAYIGGYTSGRLGGPNVGNSDAFLTKYEAAGAPLWTRQLGTARYDFGTAVCVDGAGNAYITGATEGSLGGPGAGNADAFLAKFGAPCPADLDNDGNLANGGHPDGAATIDDLL